MLLHEIKSNPGARKSKKRVGRGNGSGKGAYCGRGLGGQKSRGSGKVRPGFEGGRTPLIQKMPKLKGFKNPTKKEFTVINLEKLNAFDDGSVISLEDLYEKGLAKKSYLIKILGQGEISKKIEITAHKFSQSAKDKIGKAGGKFTEVLEPKKKKEEKDSKESAKEPAKK